MSLKGTLESRISYRIRRSKFSVFIRKDFADIGGYDQVGRILRQLVKAKMLINLGYGAYARARKSSFTNNLIPEKPLQELAKEMMRKLGVEISPSTQVPTGRVIGVKGRVSRKIGFNGKYISFEQIA